MEHLFGDPVGEIESIINEMNMKKSIQTPLGVYTDDEAGIEMIESYANQRVIEELEKIDIDYDEKGKYIQMRIDKRIKELKTKI